MGRGEGEGERRKGMGEGDGGCKNLRCRCVARMTSYIDLLSIRSHYNNKLPLRRHPDYASFKVKLTRLGEGGEGGRG